MPYCCKDAKWDKRKNKRGGEWGRRSMVTTKANKESFFVPIKSIGLS